eukprot:3151203-Amphidinium_carterae.1
MYRACIRKPVLCIAQHPHKMCCTMGARYSAGMLETSPDRAGKNSVGRVPSPTNAMCLNIAGVPQ